MSIGKSASSASSDSSRRAAGSFQDQSKNELRLFAGLGALAILLIAARAQVLRIAHLKDYYPLLFYQDVLVAAMLLWSSRASFRVFRGTRARLMLELAGWTVCLFLALYTAIATIVFWYIRSPLTYRLVALSDNGRGIKSALSEDLGRAWTAVPADMLIVIVLGLLLWRGAPMLLRRGYSVFYSVTLTVPLITYLIAANLWVTRNVHFLPAVENPEWALVASMLESPRPRPSAAIPSDYFADFRPLQQSAPFTRDARFRPLFDRLSQAQPLNIVLFVMESVGAKNLQLSGAPYGDSPVLNELARHAIVFNNTYVSQPFSSAAIAALFASLYPDHDWLTIPRQWPAIRVAKLPALLADRGYRTAFIHSGSIDYDGELEFLENDGFQEVIARAADDNQPRDDELVPAALNWIKQHRERAFFLTIWTRDAHNPYFSRSARKYTSNPALNRYLNAVAWTDQIAGMLANALKRDGLLENTLLVITGDHGEAFEEHGQSVHNFSVYNEEVRIPLMFVSERLIPQRVDVSTLARQIDIAPTLLDLLGIKPPPAWQGTSLFAGRRPPRAYLFSIAGAFRLGIVEDHHVYMRDYTYDREELYDVAADRDERNDLSGNPAFHSLIERDRIRLEAWLGFQNGYLARYACAGCPVRRHSPEPLAGLLPSRQEQ